MKYHNLRSESEIGFASLPPWFRWCVEIFCTKLNFGASSTRAFNSVSARISKPVAGVSKKQKSQIGLSLQQAKSPHVWSVTFGCLLLILRRIWAICCSPKKLLLIEYWVLHQQNQWNVFRKSVTPRREEMLTWNPNQVKIWIGSEKSSKKQFSNMYVLTCRVRGAGGTSKMLIEKARWWTAEKCRNLTKSLICSTFKSLKGSTSTI